MDLAVMVFARRPDRQLMDIIQRFPARWSPILLLPASSEGERNFGRLEALSYLSQALIRSKAGQLPGLPNYGRVSSSSAARRRFEPSSSPSASLA